MSEFIIHDLQIMGPVANAEQKLLRFGAVTRGRWCRGVCVRSSFTPMFYFFTVELVPSEGESRGVEMLFGISQRRGRRAGRQ